MTCLTRSIPGHWSQRARYAYCAAGRRSLPNSATCPLRPFVDVSAIGNLAIDDFLKGKVDQVFLAIHGICQHGQAGNHRSGNCCLWMSAMRKMAALQCNVTIPLIPFSPMNRMRRKYSNKWSPGSLLYKSIRQSSLRKPVNMQLGWWPCEMPPIMRMN